MPISNFNEIANQSADAIERPKPYPVGTYQCVVNGLYQVKEINTKNGVASKIHFPLKPIMAGPDVDQSALAAIGGLGTAPFPDMQVYLGVNDEEAQKNMWRAQAFVEACGQPVKGVSIKQMLESTQNAQVNIVIGHRPSDDGQTVYGEIKRAFKVA